eukprot:985821_1
MSSVRPARRHTRSSPTSPIRDPLRSPRSKRRREGVNRNAHGKPRKPSARGRNKTRGSAVFRPPSRSPPPDRPGGFPDGTRSSSSNGIIVPTLKAPKDFETTSVGQQSSMKVTLRYPVSSRSPDTVAVEPLQPESCQVQQPGVSRPNNITMSSDIVPTSPSYTSQYNLRRSSKSSRPSNSSRSPRSSRSSRSSRSPKANRSPKASRSSRASWSPRSSRSPTTSRSPRASRLPRSSRSPRASRSSKSGWSIKPGCSFEIVEVAPERVRMSVRSKPVDVELSERSFHSSSSESRARKRRRKYPVDPSLKPPLEPSSASPLSLPAGVKLNILEHEVVGEINSAEKSDAKYGQPANTANDMESGSDDCTNRFSHGKVFVPSQSDAKSTNVSSVGNSAVGVRPFESQKVVGLSETAIASVSRISASAGPTTSVSHLKPEPTPVLATASSVSLSPATSPVLATALVAPARFADYLNSVDVGKRGLSYPIRYRKDGRPAKKPGPKPGTRQRRKLPMNSSDTDISSATSGADQYQMFAAPSQPGAGAVHDTSSQHDTDSKLGADATSEKNLVFLPVGSSVTLVSFFRSTSQCLAIGTALSPGPNGTYVVVSFYRKREFRQPVSKFRIRESMLREVPANKVHLEPGDVIGPESIVHPNVWFGPECLLAPIRDSGLLEVVLAPRRELRLGDSFVPSAPPHFAPSVPSAPRRSLISPNSKAIANLLANLPSPTTLTEAALFAGWRLCLCGKIRPDKACMERILLDRGGIVRTGVSADLSVVVSTQKEVKRGGVKIVRAHSRNIPILDTSWVVDSIMNGKVQPVEPYAMKYVGTKRLVHLQDSGESEDLNENDSEDIESNLPPGSSALASSENSDWDDQPSNVRSGRWSIPEIKMLNDLIKRHTTVGTRLWKSELEQKLQLPKYAKLRLRNLESVRQKVALMRADKLAVMKARARDPSSGNRNPESGGILLGSSDIGEGGRRDENSIHKLADAIEIAAISGSPRHQDGETLSSIAGPARPPPIRRKSSGEKSSESPDDLYLSESDSRRSRSISGQFSTP